MFTGFVQVGVFTENTLKRKKRGSINFAAMEVRSGLCVTVEIKEDICMKCDISES